MHSSRMLQWPSRGGVCRGGYLPGGVHLPPNRIITCKNITFPQLLLRAVIKVVLVLVDG